MPKKNHKKSVIGPERESDVRNSSLDFTRRDVLSGAAALSVGVVLPTASQAAKETIVSTIFGGRFEKEYRKAIVDPFRQKYDVEVMLKYGNAGKWLTNALVNRENPEIDVVWLVYPESIKAINEDIGTPVFKLMVDAAPCRDYDLDLPAPQPGLPALSAHGVIRLVICGTILCLGGFGITCVVVN